MTMAIRIIAFAKRGPIGFPRQMLAMQPMGRTKPVSSRNAELAHSTCLIDGKEKPGSPSLARDPGPTMSHSARPPVLRAEGAAAAAGRLCLRVLDGKSRPLHAIHIIHFRTLQQRSTLGVHDHFHITFFNNRVVLSHL